MLKSEFLDLLNQKLSLINDKEKEDIILEYGTYIDDKIASGVSEEEAVAALEMWMNWLKRFCLPIKSIQIRWIHYQVKRTKQLIRYMRSWRECFLN